MENADQFNKWVGQWEKAMSSPAFAAAAPPEPPPPLETSDPEERYWDAIRQGKSYDGILNERRAPAAGGDPKVKAPKPLKAKCDLEGEKFDGASKGKVADLVANEPNPVSPTTRNQDSRSHVTPNFSCGVELVELANMRKELERLESKMGQAFALAKSDKAKDIQKQIKALWKRVNGLSDKLTPDFVREYMS